MSTLDERDRTIRDVRVAKLDTIQGPRCGDYVRFTCGTIMRISHLYPDAFQVSAGGSWYLGDGYVSFSGGLFRGAPLDTLTRLDETKDGRCWFFHRDLWAAGNGLDTLVPFRVYACAVPSPECGRAHGWGTCETHKNLD